MSEVARERADRIEKAFTKVNSFKEVLDIYSTIPVEKIKYLMRKGFIKIRNLDKVSFDFRPTMRTILDTPLEKRVDIETEYAQGTSSADIAILYSLPSRKDVRRILFEAQGLKMRMSAELEPND
jgi:hypothetical protein